MSVENKPGHIVWIDQTSKNATEVKEFYTQVAGWSAEPVKVNDYHDYNMVPPGEEDPTAGICHARSVNADLPVGWLIYIQVEDLDASMAACKKLGGDVVAGPKGMGGKSRYCVIKDPAGAVAALFDPGS
jgi:predicted enzyme related to lactoylglutathione lyase